MGQLEKPENLSFQAKIPLLIIAKKGYGGGGGQMWKLEQKRGALHEKLFLNLKDSINDLRLKNYIFNLSHIMVY